jgi:multicomponent Na+:H+ antiporter subunit A
MLVLDVVIAVQTNLLSLLILAHFLVGALMLTVLRRRPVIGAAVGIVVLGAMAMSVVLRCVGASSPLSESTEWIPELGFGINFSLDGFGVLMALIVSILGAFVLAYSLFYFEHDGTYSRFVGLFMAFAGAMTGVVLAADLFTMFVFWELTSICSFLLIGLNDTSESARKAAVRALLTTGAGGLCLLAAVGGLQVAAGTVSFVELATNSPQGSLVTASAVLILLAAFTKSAQFPFHFWLPGAMAAPTPVSAYLHSATMVKAGVVLLARTSPIFAEIGPWRWWVVLAGGATMILGGVRALGQTDAKLLLAHSTVSQLGLLTILFGVGWGPATYAGVAHLLAHAVFKVGLFLGVGVIDHQIGTRDIRRFGGLRKRMPITVAALVAGALSMAGMIPLFGFATKEKALVALLDAEIGVVGVVALVAVLIGSVFSVAYSVRLIRGLLLPKDNTVEHENASHHESSVVSGFVLSSPVVIAGAVSLVFGLVASTIGKWLVAPGSSLDQTAVSKLALWPGLNTPFVMSVVVLALGATLGMVVPLVQKGSTSSLGEGVFDRLYDATLVGAKRITSVAQSGSLPAYVAVVIAIVGAAVTTSLIAGGDLPTITRFSDSAVQFVVAALTVAFTGGVVMAKLRFTAALLLGGVGFGVAMLFVLHGAPDLALTQLLVETLTIVVFLLVMRRMPREFSPASQWAPRTVRVAAAVFIGITVPLFAANVVSSRTAGSVSEEYISRSLTEAGGRNVVNVILVDFRGFDTMGEITVLALAAMGVANLVRMASRERRSKEKSELVAQQ